MDRKRKGSTRNSAGDTRRPNIQEKMDTALRHHGAGDLAMAKELYRQILQAVPDQPVALHMLGMVAYQTGNDDDAVALMRRAVAVKPDFAGAHSNLGLILQAQGKLQDAMACYRAALRIEPNFADAHNNLGNVHKELGALKEAVACYRRALSINGDFAEAHYNLGTILQGQGQPEDAVDSYRRALAISPDLIEAHNNLGNALKEMGRLEEAVASFENALSVNAARADVRNNLGNTLRQLGQLDAAVSSYEAAISHNPDFSEAYNNLGYALREAGEIEEAISRYRTAVAIDPDFAEGHYNLGNALLERGNTQEAFSAHRQAIRLQTDNEVFWHGLAASVRTASFIGMDDHLAEDLSQLLTRSTVRPSEMARPIVRALRGHTAFSKVLGAVTPEGRLSGIVASDAVSQLSSIPLFLRLLELSPVFDLGVERLLIALRRALLEVVTAEPSDDVDLRVAASLALHCFTNEYIFPETEAETLALEALAQRTAALAAEGQDIPVVSLAVLGAYRPLCGFPWAEQLQETSWPESFRPVIERQISEPLQEQALRSGVPRLTEIRDVVSQSVRAQYEENPYPRWVRTDLPSSGRRIGTVLQGAPLRLALADYKSPEHPDILVAGCGTGQHTLNTATRFSNASVLAVDISANSLAYAQRKTDEACLTNIRYAQADILELGALDRQFDVIECVGVLHHLGDPLTGWRVLVSLLRPGGLMKIGLYSKTARRDVVVGRALVAEKHYTPAPEDIRRCRQEIIAMAEAGHPEMMQLCKRRDFYSLSECRDLLFHVQEHRFTLPQIDVALNTLGLSFLGFEMRDRRVQKTFEDRYPGETARTSLVNWDCFEDAHPDTFNGMYQFWCRKT